MKWVDKDTGIGSDGTLYVIRQGGSIEISGDNWRTKWLPDGMPKYPNARCNMGTKLRARRMVNLLDKIIQHEYNKKQINQINIQ
jgi:hypothetical protein